MDTYFNTIKFNDFLASLGYGEFFVVGSSGYEEYYTIKDAINYLINIPPTVVSTWMDDELYVNDTSGITFTSLGTGGIPLQDARIIARDVTAWYEDASGVYVTGNFDNMGLSIGYFQWNLGQNNLQPMLRQLDSQYPEVINTLFNFNDSYTYNGVTYTKGYDILRAMIQQIPTADQVAWGDSITDPSDKHLVIEPWRSAFAALVDNQHFTDIQDECSLYKYNAAETITNWMQSIDISITTRAYSLALDIAVQCGTATFCYSGHNSTHQKWSNDMKALVQDTINGQRTFLTHPEDFTVYPDNSHDYCPYSKVCSQNQYYIATKCRGFAQGITDENLKKLFYVAAVAAISEFNSDRWIKDVWERKSAIAKGGGDIRGGDYNFYLMFGLNDDIVIF